ncbi:gamma-glutamylcysteine synthetase, partial [Rhizobium aquaticum]
KVLAEDMLDEFHGAWKQSVEPAFEAWQY